MLKRKPSLKVQPDFKPSQVRAFLAENLGVPEFSVETCNSITCFHSRKVGRPVQTETSSGPAKDVDGLSFSNLGRVLAAGGYRSGAEPEAREGAGEDTWRIVELSN